MSQETKHIIIAPHADDEIIGCSRIIEDKSVGKIIFPEWNLIALKESEKLLETIGSEPYVFEQYADLYEFVGEVADNGGLAFFPDPVHELHPDHRIIGAMGERLLKKDGFGNIVFYSTNMNAPYIQELSKEDQQKKRELLDFFYPQKSDLWKYDWRYFLFEGYCMWNIPNELI